MRFIVTAGVLSLLVGFCPSLPAATRIAPTWTDYQVILWMGNSIDAHPGTEAQCAERLKEMGVTGVSVQQESDPQSWLRSGLQFYVENIVNRGLCLKYGSSVTDWDRFVTEWAKGGRPHSALVRGPSLDDPTWQAASLKQMTLVVQKQKPNHPLLYDIRDELSTTISANPFDYDFHPLALASFRRGLQTAYGTLEALNREWETAFPTWESVMPFTTDEIKARMASGKSQPGLKPDWGEVQQTRFNAVTAASAGSISRWNFSPWADFRSYMDSSLSRELDRLRQAAHAIDPLTPVGIEGTQMPHAFGGYDLWKLSQALDWIEPYDIGNAREILGDFMPGGSFLTTVGEARADEARRRLWHLLMLGDRGNLVWWSEDSIQWSNDGWKLTDRAMKLAPVLKSLRSPLAQVIQRAQREADPILLHYSQSSVQVDWLLESIPDGSTWLRRFSSFEASHNRMTQARNQWVKGLQDLGFTPQFISSSDIERGRLSQLSPKVLILPRSTAISDREAQEFIRLSTPSTEARPVQRILADGSPGVFDEHGRLRQHPALRDLFPAMPTETLCRSTATARQPQEPGAVVNTGILGERMRETPGAAWMQFMIWLEDNTRTVPRPVRTPIADRIRTHRYRLGSARVVAFERGVDYQMGESLKAQGGNAALEKPIETTADFDEAGELYDLQTGKHMGHTDHIQFHLDPWTPSLFAILPKPTPNSVPVLDWLLQQKGE